jgi:hypothetical protein
VNYTKSLSFTLKLHHWGAGVDVKVIFILVILYAIGVGLNATNVQTKEGFDFSGAVGWWIEKPAGTISIVVAVIIFLFQQRSDRQKIQNEKRDTTSNSCNALLEEIRDHRDAFTKPEYQADYITVDQQVRYTTRKLVTDAYDSLLFSGILNHFKTETQNSLSNLYLRIKLHNELLTYLNRYHDTFFLYDSSPRRWNLWNDSVRPYQVLLSSYQRDIMDSLDGVEVLIQRELPR